MTKLTCRDCGHLLDLHGSETWDDEAGDGHEEQWCEFDDCDCIWFVPGEA